MALPFLDTDILMRHFLQDHPDHSPRATAYIARVERGEIQVRISEIVVFETVFLLSRHYKQSKEVVRDLVLGFLALPGVVMPGKRHFTRVFELYVELNVAFADAYHIALMERQGLDEVVTFDREFDHAAGIRHVEP
jgi:predicted nucleic acid-binding protein